VILDRYVDSSLAYQGGGRHLGVGEVRAINLFATHNLEPDRTLLLRVSPAVGRARLEGRALAEGAAGDRLEGEGEAFFAAIADAYEELALLEPERIRALDASQPPELVLQEALAAVDDLFRSDP
jgi:dTMP kinase